MRSRLRNPSLVRLLVLLLACFAGVDSARAEGVVPPATELPETLSLEDAVRIFRARGLDLLIADAATRSVEGAVRAAGAIPNPTVTASVGNGISFSQSAWSTTNCLQNGAQCTPWIYNLGITDSAALEDTVSGKRDLRQIVARNALAAAKMNRADAERMIVFQVKTAYLQVAQATLGYRFAREVAASNATTLTKFQARYRAGAINDGDLQRIETQKLESDQALELAVQNLRQARAALALLLGVRGEVPDFDVDAKVLDFTVPASLKDATAVRLLHLAFDHRPDLLALGYEMASNEAQIRLTRRQRFPDIALGVNYAWGGFGGLSTNGPLGPQVITFSLSSPIPIFYQLAGELRQAEAQYDTTALTRAKTTAQVVNDVTTGVAAFSASRALVERMEGPRRPGGGLLESAKGAFDVVAIQYEKGAASITDYLDALRTYIATRVEYFLDLTNYWTAVFQLEQAVATDLRP
jgi:cobalt-zinc-cadmium efflux system outer membrane protein